MGLFDVFNPKKRQIRKLEKVLEVLRKIFEIVKKRKSYTERDIVDYKFQENFFDDITVLEYFKSGVLNWISKEHRQTILNLFSSGKRSGEEYKKWVDESHSFLKYLIENVSYEIEELKKGI